jgi:hypothetical protein
MKLLTWNGQVGKATRAWPSLVERLGIDVAFLQEVFQPSSDFTFLWEAVPGYKWGTAVVAGHGRFQEIHVAGYDGCSNRSSSRYQQWCRCPTASRRRPRLTEDDNPSTSINSAQASRTRQSRMRVHLYGWTVQSAREQSVSRASSAQALTASQALPPSASDVLRGLVFRSRSRSR